MRWPEIDIGSGTWMIPGERTKNGKPHEVAVVGLAAEILANRYSNGIPVDGFVFPSVRPNKVNAGRTALSGFSNAKERIDAAMGDCPPWTFHDLRRTATTFMAEIGVQPLVADRVLNHTAGTIRGVAAVYNRYDYRQEQRDALMKWERRLREIVGGEP